MRKLVVMLVLAAVVGVASALSARAAEGGGAGITLETCGRAYDACVEQCEADYGAGTVAAAGCGARCAAERAGCEAMVGVDKAQPWLEKRMKDAEEFLDGFLGKQDDDGEAAPPPGRDEGAEPDSRRI